MGDSLKKGPTSIDPDNESIPISEQLLPNTGELQGIVKKLKDDQYMALIGPFADTYDELRKMLKAKDDSTEMADHTYIQMWVLDTIKQVRDTIAPHFPDFLKQFLRIYGVEALMRVAMEISKMSEYSNSSDGVYLNALYRLAIDLNTASGLPIDEFTTFIFAGTTGTIAECFVGYIDTFAYDPAKIFRELAIDIEIIDEQDPHKVLKESIRTAILKKVRGSAKQSET